ncbi:MAG: alpha-mannosidase [Spirochaetaceae bacterium JB067]
METKKNHIHLIGNAHIDVLWLWDWNEGIQEIRSTFASALDRIDEHDDFIFTSAGAYYYQVVERVDPPLFRRIRKAVADGRWHITGGWWLQPDCNAPSAESFVRQGLYGQRYYLKRFNKIATSGYNVDSFGHNGNLPQILKKMGINHYVFMRPGKSEKKLPSSVFEWVGIDGSKVRAFRIPPNYNNSSDWGELLDDKIAMMREYIKDEKLPLMAFYGVGNHGGGPTKENLKILDSYCEKDPSIFYSDVGKYFDQLKDCFELHQVKDDLQFHAIGCYSAYSRIKKLNNRAENALVCTEKILSVTNAPQSDFDMVTESWKKVLVNQFHDALGGCSIPQAYDKVINSYGSALECADELTTFSLQQLVSRIKTFDEGSTLIIFNPHPLEISQMVELNILCEKIIDLQGNSLDLEIVPSDSIGNSFTHHTRVIVTVPPLGYTCFHVINPSTRLNGESLRKAQYVRTLKNTLRSNNLTVTIDRERGVISSIKDHKTGIEYVGREGISPVMIDDDSDTWSHALHAYNGRVHQMDLRSFTMVSDGKVSTEYELVYLYNNSRVILRLILIKDLDVIDISMRVQFNEQHKILALRCAAAVDDSAVFSTEIPGGTMVREANGDEYPVQRWTHVGTSEGKGLCVINNGVYSANSRSNVMHLTCLRSPIYAHHEPAHPRSDITHKYMEFGEHDFSFRILPTVSKEDKIRFARESAVFNQRPIVQIESVHDGSLPLSHSFAAIEGGDSIMLSTIKRSEDKDGLIVRLYETCGIKTEGVFRFENKSVRQKLYFEPFEMKTFYIEDGGTVKETDLLERLNFRNEKEG